MDVSVRSFTEVDGDFRRRNDRCRLLVSLLNAMGVEVNSFGAAGYGGALTELHA